MTNGLRDTLRKAAAKVKSAFGPGTPTHAFRGFDIPIDLMRLTGGGPETFDAIAEGHLRNVERYAGLAPDHSVLEIGCGIGRDAIPLTAKLSPSGRYLGVDIVAPSIRWCTMNITSRHPNFRFVQFDVRDELHNPAGTRGARDFTVPLDDRSVDRIIVQSVFTHLLAPEVSHYLQEFHRVLKDDGRVYATFFVYDDAVLDKARETNLTPFDLRFEHEFEPGCRINDPSHPLGAVAYSRDRLDAMFRQCGLRLAHDIIPGAWSGYYEHREDGQDVAILARDDSA